MFGSRATGAVLLVLALIAGACTPATAKPGWTYSPVAGGGSAASPDPTTAPGGGGGMTGRCSARSIPDQAYSALAMNAWSSKPSHTTSISPIA